MNDFKIPKIAKISALTGVRNMEVKELPVPEINDDEILVHVEGCGICGTDVHEFKGDPFGFIPVQLGHEGTGIIVKLGKNVTKDYYGKPLAVGDKIVTGLRPCGKCDTCTKHPEKIHLCEGGEIFGLIPGESAYFNGWFGEYIKINPGGVVFNVSDMDLDLRILIEPAAVIVHAVEKAKEIFNFKHDSCVLVQGCGPIGLLLLTLVRTMGVRNIIAVDTDQKRLDIAKKLGASAIVNVTKTQDPVADVKVLTNGLGAEMAFQCTGSPKAASMVWNYVRRGGALCELGFFVNNGDATYNPHLDICNKEIKVVGSWTYQACDWIQACEFLKEAQLRGIPVEELISHRYGLEEMNEAMEMNISMQGCKIIYQNKNI
ncbi:zinc-dependent alcohol dehydrogenase [Sporomusa acidovorans]|uniref:Sorbitol dehydrogenase n=1 Tax=Sporomusa acidovorans (strain ATCC 49682 / DSM 3132 / Mol) TaxID=1123286 RepID=A0ABZ3JAX5_SPOA4|nr:zinc-binding dehydrogenase [Sporomusa acidovorans]OZC16986.1 sorbitol dehydrogenase [Sporomusa acidovorans DSM 3132]SDF33343.1 L-iditol 2-dehydrogenase [Sporomusa acidovorans]